MAPICDKLCTNSRMGSPVVFNTIDLAVRRPTTSSHLESDLSFTLFAFFPFAKVYHVFFVRSKENELNRVVAHSNVPNRPVLPTIPQICFHHSQSVPILVPMLLLRTCLFLCERPWKILCTPYELSLLPLSGLVSLAFQDTVKPSADRCR